MSDKVHLAADGSVQAKLQDVRSENMGPNAFIVIGYNPEVKNELIVIAEEKGGITEAMKYLPEDDCRYVLLRINYKVEMANTVKFVFVDWTPNKLKPLRKAQVGTHKQQVQNHLKPFHAHIDASDYSDLSENLVSQKIGAASGTASNIVPTRSTSPPTRSTSPSPRTQSPTGRSSSQTTEKKEEKTKIEFTDENQFHETIKQVRNSKDVNWMLASYVKKDTLGVIGSGNGGLNELLSKLETENVDFGLLRVSITRDNHSETRFVYLKWQPDSIKPMKKAEINTRSSPIAALFAPYHCDFHISRTDEITEQTVLDAVLNVSGVKSRVVDKQSAQ